MKLISFKAVCKLCDKEIQVTNNGYHSLCNMQGKKPYGKSVVGYTVLERESDASRKHEIDIQQSVCSLDSK